MAEPQVNIQELLFQLLLSQSNQNKYGDEEPQDLGYQKDVANYQQDQFDLLGDPILASLAGGGSYDPRAFQDVVKDYDEFEIPSDPLGAWRNLSPESEEGKIVRAIEAGFSPEEIAAQFQTAGVADPDAIGRIRERATEMFQGQFEYQNAMQSVPGMVQTEDGQWAYQGDGEILGNKVRLPNMERSEAAQFYDKQGLPTPDQQFTLSDFGHADQGQGYAADQQALTAARQGITSAQGAQAGALRSDIRLAAEGGRMDALLARALQGGDRQVAPDIKYDDGQRADPSLSRMTPRSALNPNDPGVLGRDEMLGMDLKGLGGGTPLVSQERAWDRGGNIGLESASMADRLAQLAQSPEWGNHTPQVRDAMRGAQGRLADGSSGAREREQEGAARKQLQTTARKVNSNQLDRAWSRGGAKRRQQISDEQGLSPLIAVMLKRAQSLRGLG